MRLVMNRVFLIAVLLGALTGTARGQELDVPPVPPPDSVAVVNNAYVRISTNAPDAYLFADSIRIGRVPHGFFALPPATERLRLTLPDANTWTLPPVETELALAAGDSVEIDLRFPYMYRIESIPFGARVNVEQGGEWEYLGVTPLLHSSAEPIIGLLVVERPGFTLERLEPGRDVWNRHIVMLRPSDELDPTAAQVNWQPPKQRRVWIDYVALGTAVAAGVVAVHYKFKADDLYSTYEDTADPALRDDIHAHDVRSGVAFGVMQAGLGLFAIRLVLR